MQKKRAKMKITVKIQKDDQGQFTVGVDGQEGGDQTVEGLMAPEGNMPAGEHTMPDGQTMGGMEAEGGMSPAADLEDALNQARTLLDEPQTEQEAFASA